jgi:hypothetical protein
MGGGFVNKGYFWLVIPVLALAGCVGAGDVGPGVWPEGTSVVFDKQVGRFVSFEVDGEEYFWKNPEPTVDPRTGWVDYGGDKVWVLPQDQWKKYLGRVWPPGKDLEGLPWKGEYPQEAETEVSPAGVRVMRDWGPAGREKGFYVWTTVERISKVNHAPVHVWGIGQVKGGEFGLIGLGRGGLKDVNWFGNGKQACGIVNDAQGAPLALVVRPGGAGGKVGTMGRWVAAVYKDRVLVRLLAQPAGHPSTYAERSSVELFQTREFWELETLGQLTDLTEVSQTSVCEVWMVIQRPGGLNEAGLAVWVDEKVKEKLREIREQG